MRPALSRRFTFRFASVSLIASLFLIGACGVYIHNVILADFLGPEYLNPVRPPINIGRAPLIVDSALSNTVSWEAVPGAESYNVYERDTQIASGLTATHYDVPVSHFQPPYSTYTITTVIGGRESIPSAPAYAMFPGNIINFSDGRTPTAPNRLSSKTWMNDGRPMVRIDAHNIMSEMLSLYRDGVRLSKDTSMTYALDDTAAPGSTHSYTLSVSYMDTNNVMHESPQSDPLSVTAALSAPSTLGVLSIAQVNPNNNSVKITVQPYPHAVEYRAYSTASPNKVKYFGGNTTGEINGLSSTADSTIVVEALDALGPFQRSDGFWGPGTIIPNTSTPIIAFNGQGDPAYQPNAIARSEIITVHPKAFALTGQQAFFDGFDINQAFTSIPYNHILQNIQDAHLAVTQEDNDKWKILNIQTNQEPQVNFDGFFMSNHFMHDTSSLSGIAAGHTDMLQDGQPHSHPVLATGQVLHATFEVDSFSDGNRWMGLGITPQSDFVGGAGPDGNWSTTNKEIDIRTDSSSDGALIVSVANGGGGVLTTEIPNSIQGAPTWLMRPSSLDLRNKFDFYVSKNQIVTYENDQLVGKYDLSSMPLNWIENTPLAVAYYSATYHIPYADRIYLYWYSPAGGPDPQIDGYLGFDPATGINERDYYANYRPFNDERHWNNQGSEVMDAMPPDPVKPNPSGNLTAKVSVDARTAGHYAVSNVTVKLTDVNGGGYHTFDPGYLGQATSDSQASGSFSVLLSNLDPGGKINDNATYKMEFSAPGFLGTTITATHVLSNPVGVTLRFGDLKNREHVGLEDVVDVIRAFTGQNVPAVTAANDGNPLADLRMVATIIRNYRLQ